MNCVPAVAVIFWACAAVLFYTYAGYPLLIWALSRCFGPRRQTPAEEPDSLPSLSLLIAAHNEAPVIGQRIRNALALDYPRDKLEILVASDGSADATPDIVRRYAGQGVRLLDYPCRRGKAAVLQAAVAELKGEIILLSDANTSMDPSAARRLARWFGEPGVGVVCGRLVLTDPRTGRNVDSLYWRYETFLKRCEGRLGALLGANGAIYAVRRECFTPPPADTIIDDFAIPLLARLRSGCAIVYDDEATAREETPPEIAAEFRRRSRIGAGGFQSMGMLLQLLHPRSGWVAFTFLSHKVFRWLGPFFLLGVLTASALLWQQPFYRHGLLVQLGFYLISPLTAIVPARMRFLRPLRLAAMFSVMNAALLVGFWRWLRGRQSGIWERTDRLAAMGGEAA